LDALYKLVVFAIIETRSQRRSQFAKSALHATKSGQALICEIGIEKGAGPDDIVKIGKVTNLIHILVIVDDRINVGIIEHVKAKITQIQIMGQCILQLGISKLDAVEIVQNQTLRQARHIGKRVSHIIAKNQILRFFELDSGFKIRKDSNEIILKCLAKLNVLVAVGMYGKPWCDRKFSCFQAVVSAQIDITEIVFGIIGIQAVIENWRWIKKGAII
jgi:hypothetical protein